MVGPSFDYAEYRRWIETTMFEVPAGTDPSRMPPTRKKRKIPRSGTPAAWKAAAGLAWIFLFLKFSGWYNSELVVGDQYMKYGFLRRVWILQMLGFTSRLKYYGVWSLTEGACILSGLGYKGIDPKTGRVQWNRLQNVNPWGIETAQNTRAYLEGWNMNTNNWLRNYMYLRVTPKGKKPGFRASLATFVTSAFWHGFYPGYYLTFILGAFLQTVAKSLSFPCTTFYLLLTVTDFRRHVRPFFLTPDGQRPTPYKRYYDVLSYVTTQVAFCFTTAPFVLLTLPDSLLVWARVYFYAIIGVAASVAFFASPAKQWLDQHLRARNHPIPRSASQETLDGTLMGLPSDPGRDFDEAMQEVRDEVEARRRKGTNVAMPRGEQLKSAVADKLGKEL